MSNKIINLDRLEISDESNIAQARVIYIDGDGDAVTAVVDGYNPATEYIIDNAACRWSVLLAVFCRSEDGEQYLDAVRQTTNKCYKVDIPNQIERHYAKLMKEVDSNDVITTGWIAAPVKVDYDIAEAVEIFQAHGAWFCYARHETTKQ